jgi:hypothetical protein
MQKIPVLALLTLAGALLAGPTYAAPQYGGTPGGGGSGGAGFVDCTDAQHRFDPYCESIAAPAPKPLTSAAVRTNELACPAGNLVSAGVDRNGNRLYRCAPQANSPAMNFTY